MWFLRRRIASDVSSPAVVDRRRRTSGGAVWRRTTKTPAAALALVLACAAVVLLLLLPPPPALAQSACPSECTCKWKSGKQTVECQNKDLLVLPPGIDARTQVLDVSGNRLQILPREVFAREGLRNLQKIYLNNCQISQIEARAFYHLTNLVELDLSNNLLTSIPTVAFVDTPSLRSLNLNYNPIERIQDKAFQGVAALIRLEMSGCKIASITPQGFRGLKGLEKLKIDGNDLTYIPEEAVAGLQNVYQIELHSNPWHCDCTLLPLRDLLFEYRIPYPVSPVCASPARVAGRKFDRLDIDEFACKPEVVVPPSAAASRQVDVDAYYNENATIDCVVAAVPEPEIEWFHGDDPLKNGSVINGDHVVFVTHRGHERKTSTLTITEVRESVDGVYTCAARNPAGYDVVNFTLTTSLRAVNLAGLTYDQIAGIILALIVLIIVILGIIVVLLVRMRNNNSAGSGGAGHGGNNNNNNYANKASNVNGAGSGGAGDDGDKKAMNGLKQSNNTMTANGSIMTIRDPYQQLSMNPDLINEAKNTVTLGRVSSNGYINHIAEHQQQQQQHGHHHRHHQGAAAAAMSPDGDDLYPRGFWLPDVGVGPAGAATTTTTSPTRTAAYASNNNSNSSYDAASYDSYEPLKHSTPLHSKYPQWKTPPSPIDPTRYGYPADFGLPIIPPSASAVGNSTSTSPTTTALLNYSAEGSVVSSSVGVGGGIFGLADQPLYGAARSTAVDDDDDVVPSPATATPKSLRVKQQGVCVLPPLPSIFKAQKNPESPDEGYQEDGTEV